MIPPKIMLAGAGEKTQYLAHNFNDNTIRFILHYPQKINADALCSATGALVSSVNILHASFIPGNLGAYWHVNREYSPIDYFTLFETKTETMATAVAASLKAVAPESAVQLHCTLVQGINESAIALTISHLCVDGGDGKYLLGKLIEAYNLMIQKQNTDTLLVKNGSRAAEQVYEELTPKEYFSLIKNPLSGVKTMFPFPSKDTGMLRMVWKNIPNEVMTNARSRAKKENATANDILLTAFYRAYASLSEVDETAAMSIMSMMDLRQHCKNGESDGLCNMSGSLPTTLKQGVHGSFSDTLSEVSEQTRAAKADPLAGLSGMPILHGVTHTTPMWLMLQAAERVYGSLSLGLTNLGNISCESLALNGLLPDNGIFGGPLKKKPSMQVSAVSFDGAPTLAIVGEFTKEDADALQGLLDNITTEITNYAQS